jgi:hypothetical protein
LIRQIAAIIHVSVKFGRPESGHKKCNRILSAEIISHNRTKLVKKKDDLYLRKIVELGYYMAGEFGLYYKDQKS